MHSPNPSAFAFRLLCLYRVRSGKKDSKKFVSCRYYKRVPKQLHFFHLKFSEYTNVQRVRLPLTLSIIKDENSIRKRALWAKMKKLNFLRGVLWG